MPDLRHRSAQTELLDRDDIPFADIRQNMRELDRINHRLGGHAISKRGFRALTKGIHSNEPLRVVEIGCGGGDNLRVIRDEAARLGMAIHLTGVDINPECIRYAESLKQNEGIRFLCSDYRLAGFEEQPHIIFSSLFCHHFSNEDLVAMLQWMQAHSTLGFFINDLHRHALAYHSIRILTRLLSRSYLVRNDAPISVARGFRRNEWTSIFREAGLQREQVTWCWAFRWLILYRHEHNDAS